jgi:hypothetical protein
MVRKVQKKNRGTKYCVCTKLILLDKKCSISSHFLHTSAKSKKCCFQYSCKSLSKESAPHLWWIHSSRKVKHSKQFNKNGGVSGQVMEPRRTFDVMATTITSPSTQSTRVIQNRDQMVVLLEPWNSKWKLRSTHT